MSDQVKEFLKEAIEFIGVQLKEFSRLSSAMSNLKIPLSLPSDAVAKSLIVKPHFSARTAAVSWMVKEWVYPITHPSSNHQKKT